jgi:hypothetical protein
MVRPVALEGAASLQDELRAGDVDGETDAAEHAPEAAVEVEEAKVQARGCRDANGAGVRARALGGCLSLRCVGQWHYGPTCWCKTSPQWKRGQYGG